MIYFATCQCALLSHNVSTGSITLERPDETRWPASEYGFDVQVPGFPRAMIGQRESGRPTRKAGIDQLAVDQLHGDALHLDEARQNVAPLHGGVHHELRKDELAARLRRQDS